MGDARMAAVLFQTFGWGLAFKLLEGQRWRPRKKKKKKKG